MISNSLHDLLADASHLAFEVDLSTGEGNMATLESNFYNMALVRPGYEKITLLDTNGKEILKVTNETGFPRVSQDSDLMDWSGQDFIKIGRKLREGQFYVPRFVLRQDKTESGIQTRRVISMIMPIFERADQGPCCLVKIDLSAEALFSHLEGSLPTELATLYFVDESGSILPLSDADMEWAQAFGADETFQSLFPEAWAVFQENRDGIIEAKDKLVVYHGIDLVPEGQLFFENRVGKTGIYQHPENLINRYFFVSIIYTPTFWGKFEKQPLLFLLVMFFVIISAGFFAWGLAILLAKRQNALQAISDNETFLRTVTETMVDGLIVINPKGILQSMNSAAGNIFGYREDELMGEKIETIMFPDMAKIHNEAISNYLTTGKAKILGKSPRQLVGKRKDGSEVFIELAVAEVKNDTTHLFIASVRDITETRKLQEQYRLLAEESRDIILLHDRNANVLYVSPAVERILGYGQKEYQNKKPFQFIHPDDLALVKKAHESHLWTKMSSAPVVYRMKKKSGPYIWIETVVRPILDSQEEITSFITSMRDVTQRVEVEEQLRQAQKMESVGQLTGGVSHEFNNVLQVITGGLTFMQDDENLTENQQELIKMALKSSKKGAELVKYMLSFSRKQTLKPQPVDLKTLLPDYLNFLSKSLTSAVEITLDLSNKLPKIYVDKNAFEIAFLNIAENAADAMPRGGTFKVSAKRRKISPTEARKLNIQPGAYVVLTAADSGKGMSKKELEKVFDPFFTTKSVDEGSGLGMSMVYGFARQSEGGVEIASQPGKGTTVTLYLPEAPLPA